MFAILLPMLLIFCGFAINLAYMQVVSTELKISTDAAAHAGGRAMSVAQTNENLTTEQKRIAAIEAGIAKAQEIAQLNTVAGRTLTVGDEGSGAEVQIAFGVSTRQNGGYGMYDYVETPTAQVMAGSKRPSSLRVTSNLELPMVFRVMKNVASDGSPARNMSSFAPSRTSIATQVDRDIALVLDRSGSMAYYKDDDALEDRIYDIYNTYETQKFYYYSYWSWSGEWVTVGDPVPDHWDGPYGNRTNRLISRSERDNALRSLYSRRYSDNLIYQLERWDNDAHTLGSSYTDSENGQLTQPMAQYARDFDQEYRYSNSEGAPRHSRWSFLIQGVDAFLDVLDETDQEELVTLVTFSSSASLDQDLQESTDRDSGVPSHPGGYANIRHELETIRPYGGTAVGDGLLTGLPPIIPDEDDPSSKARPFAAKTIVVLTDGISNSGTSPGDAVEDIVGNSSVNVTIHAVTFTPGADQSAMEDVAEAGRGRHYHDNDGTALVDIFEEIANNLPTILTDDVDPTN
jgi:Flp pilus assembly protein TadG